VATGRLTGRLDELDARQQRSPWLGFPYAVYQKFQDDQAGNLASLLAYYAFFSIFPLLLVLVTVLGFALHGDPQLESRVFNGALGLFPIIGQSSPVHPLTGSVPALVIGSVLALYSGLAVAQQAQSAFNTAYAVPRNAWPGFLPRTLRSIAAVAVAGTGFIASTLLSGAITGAGSYGLDLGVGLRIIAAAVAVAVNALLFAAVFRFLTERDLTWRDTLPGACLAAVGWYALQLLGTALVAHQLKGAQGTYGTFATVIGLLSFFHLQAQLTLYAVEVNVVRTEALWPRSLRSLQNQPRTAADRRSYRRYAERNRYAPPAQQQVSVTFDRPDDADQPGPTPGPRSG